MIRPAVGVVLGVGAGDDEHVERQPQHVAADLDVALLHDVEHRHLDALGEVGQLVDRDDAAVAARDEAEVDGLGVAEPAALGHPHRVDVTDQVGDAGVGGGELLGVPLVAVPPLDRQVVTALGRPPLRLHGDRLERVLAQLGPGDDRRPLVEQADQAAQQAGLALAALAEQHDVVAGEQGALELGDDAAAEAVQPGPRVVAGREGGEQVVADLGAHGPGDVPGGAQLADGGRGGTLAHRLTIRPRTVGDRPISRPWTRALVLSHPQRALRFCGTGFQVRVDHTVCGSAAVAVHTNEEVAHVGSGRPGSR